MKRGEFERYLSNAYVHAKHEPIDLYYYYISDKFRHQTADKPARGGELVGRYDERVQKTDLRSDMQWHVDKYTAKAG